MRRPASSLGRRAGLAAILSTCLAFAGAPEEDEPIVTAMRAELERTKASLSLPGSARPYYVGYWVVDASERSVEATLGALVSDTSSRDRFVKVDLRVGSPSFDNSNVGAGSGAADISLAEQSPPRPAPIDPDPAALRRELWLATDTAYKAAIEAFERKRASKQSELSARPEVPSFSAEAPVEIAAKEANPVLPGEPDVLARSVSSVFRAYPDIQRSEVHVLTSQVRRRFVSTEGTLAIEPDGFAGLEVTAETQADDGMALERTALVAARPGAAISEDAARAEAKRIAGELVALRTAKVAEDYAGPVLFEGRAAAQIAYEMLGEALSGTPAPGGDANLDGPLARRIGKRILPRGMNVVDDPTIAAHDGIPLLGRYAFDDEGVPARRVSLVEDGHLKTLLMSRTPREGILASNGHGRSGLVDWARGRPANLIVTTKSGLSKKDLRARLLAAVREEGAEYGLIVSELATRTGATSGEAVPAPEVAYRLAPDGKETLLRGGSFAPIAVRDLRDILATGKEPFVYSFVEEADGGLDTRVSVVCPALLFEDIELRAPAGPNKRPPAVPRPPVSSGASSIRTAPRAIGAIHSRASRQHRTPSE